MQGIVITKSKMKAHGVSGACTIVYDTDNERLIRIVSNEEGAPISNPAYNCLDIIEVELLRPCPLPPQSENYLANTKSIHVIGQFDQGVHALYKKIKNLENSHSLKYMSDHSYTISEENVQLYNHSVEMMRVRNLFIWGQENKDGNVKTLAGFTDSIGRGYPSYYSVTDNNYSLMNANERRDIGDAYIVVSIPYKPLPNQQKLYKFVAAIYPF